MIDLDFASKSEPSTIAETYIIPHKVQLMLAKGVLDLFGFAILVAYKAVFFHE